PMQRAGHMPSRPQCGRVWRGQSVRWRPQSCSAQSRAEVGLSRGIQQDSQATRIVNSLQMGEAERAGPIAERMGLASAV
ncbi:hypothetical protein, partial [Streptococcus pneumoniae]|uniref:hypothetical protein n=1 Tax=Streptococcus pneumoniae TaxID=1313 RepID=UPI001E47C84E